MRTDEARPLDRYPLVNTSIADEMQAALSQTYAKPAIEFIDGDRAIRTTVNHRQLRHVGLIYASFGASLHLRYPETDLAEHRYFRSAEKARRVPAAPPSRSIGIAAW